MRRFMLIGLVTALLLLSIAPLQAQDAAGDPRTLAQNLPAETLAYIGIRTDQAFFETLNDLITQLATSMGEDVPEGGVLAEIDKQIQTATNGRYNFETGIRSWLGGSVVFAIPPLMQTLEFPNPQLVLAEVTDKAALLEVLGLALEGDTDITVEEGDGFTYYRSSDSFDSSYLVTNDVLYVGAAGVIDMVTGEQRGASLAGNAQFVEAYDVLAEDNYALFGYLNGATVVQALQAYTSTDAANSSIDFEKLEAAINVQSFGGAMLDDRTFALDMALVHGDSTIAQALNLPDLPEFTMAPIDPALASLAPIDTVVYTAGTNQGSMARDLFAYMEAVAPALADLIEPMDEKAAFNLRAGLPTIVNVVRGFVTDVFGVPFNDLMLMMDGQNVTFTRFTGDGQTMDYAQIYQNLRPEYNEALMNGTLDLLTRFEVPFTNEEGRIKLDGAALSRILAAELENLDDLDEFDDFDDDMLDAMPPLEDYVFALNNDYVMVGTEEAVNFVFNGNRVARLNSTAAYQHQIQYLLPDATSFSYVAMAPFLAMASADAGVEMDFEGAQLFESFAWSTGGTADASLLRFTMALLTE